MTYTLSEKYGNFIGSAKFKRALFWLIMAIGIFARIYRFGEIPAGLNQDEAFAGYEAWSLLTYGTDSFGYHNPVYLIAWGSGMNALETYLMIPFIALFGLEVWVIRLPQVIVACLSLPTVYGLVKRTVNERAGLLAMFMLAICPWHIILSRWGLESNLAPGFLLFGLYFFVRGVDNPRFLPLSALMYGLSLYTYVTIWAAVPVILFIQIVYCLIYKKIRIDKYFVLSGVIIVVLAMPLLLFLVVNYGYIEPIRTGIFSIPRLVAMRRGEIGLSEMPEKLHRMKNIFIFQNDGYISNSPSRLGFLYFITLPFTLVGLIGTIKHLAAAIRKKQYCPQALLLVQLAVCLPLSFLIFKPNVNKLNCLFIPIVIFAALGIIYISALIKKLTAGKSAAKADWSYVFTIAVIAIYFALFTAFECYYFTDYKEETKSFFDYGFGDAFAVAQRESGDDTIYLDGDIYHPLVLFYAQEPREDYINTVKWSWYPVYYLDPLCFDNYVFGIDEDNLDADGAYIFYSADDATAFTENGFKLEYYGKFCVAYKD